jgi:hypothetical protein
MVLGVGMNGHLALSANRYSFDNTPTYSTLDPITAG